MKPIILQALPKDLPEILDLLQRLALKNYVNEEYKVSSSDINYLIQQIRLNILELAKRLNERKHFNMWKAVIGNKIVGFSGAVKENGKQVIGFLYVEEEFQKQKIGKQLYKEAYNWLDHSKEIIIDVVTYNYKAIEIYKKWGYIEDGVWENRKFEDGRYFPEVKMVKKPKL